MCADAGFFRGTSAEQDNRFTDKEKKLLKQMKFSETIIKKVDMSRVNLDILKPWISNRISELLGMEDDVLNEFVFNQLEANNNPDGRRIQINLTGFLNGKNARVFTAELWDLLLDAMEHSGVPSVLLNAKKAEISQRFQQQEDQRNQDEKSQRNSRSGNDVSMKSNTPYDDRKTHSRYQQQDHQSHNKHHDRQQQSLRSQDDTKSRKREEDYNDRDREDRTRSRDENSRKRSRFSDIQPESDVSVIPTAERPDLPRVEKSPDEPPKIKTVDIQPEDNYEKVEMKKRKKKDKHHHRKRRKSSSSRDDDYDGRSKKSRSRERKKKKKKSSSSKRHDKYKERSEDGTTAEQELRVRALESMKKQKRLH